MARVRLLDSTGFDTIAAGEIDDRKVGDCSGIIRNDLHFRYVGMRNGGELTFQEVEPPLIVTEF